jgi:hypothetical protein
MHYLKSVSKLYNFSTCIPVAAPDALVKDWKCVIICLKVIVTEKGYVSAVSKELITEEFQI